VALAVVCKSLKEWRAGKPEPQDLDKAFLGWVRKFTKGKPPE